MLIQNHNTKNAPTVQVPQEEEILIFNIAGSPTFMYSENQFWINLTTIFQWLGTIERAVLLSGEVRLFFNDPDAGTYVLLDALISLCPTMTQKTLNEQREKIKSIMDGAQ